MNSSLLFDEQVRLVGEGCRCSGAPAGCWSAAGGFLEGGRGAFAEEWLVGVAGDECSCDGREDEQPQLADRAAAGEQSTCHYVPELGAMS